MTLVDEPSGIARVPLLSVSSLDAPVGLPLGTWLAARSIHSERDRCLPGLAVAADDDIVVLTYDVSVALKGPGMSSTTSEVFRSTCVLAVNVAEMRRVVYEAVGLTAESAAYVHAYDVIPSPVSLMSSYPLYGAQRNGLPVPPGGLPQTVSSSDLRQRWSAATTALGALSPIRVGFTYEWR